MSRIQGKVNAALNYERQINQPLDATSVVSAVADLTDAETFKSPDGVKYCYYGMLVSVTEKDDTNVYKLVNLGNNKTANEAQLNSSNWVKIGTTPDLTLYKEINGKTAVIGQANEDDQDAVVIIGNGIQNEIESKSNALVVYHDKLILGNDTTDVVVKDNINFNSTVEANHQKDTYPNSTKAMGWYLQGYEQVSANDKTWKLYLGKEQKAFDDITVGKPTGWSGEGLNIENINVDDLFTFYNSTHYINALEVKSINSDKSITVVDSGVVNYAGAAMPPRTASLYAFRYGLYVSGKIVSNAKTFDFYHSKIGIVDLTMNSTTFGYDNINIGYNGTIIGRSNTNIGQNNLTVGNKNVNSGYASLVTGSVNTLYGEQNIVNGNVVKILEGTTKHSIANGAGIEVYNAPQSFTSGNGLTNKNNKVLVGQYNKITDGDIFVVGCGTGSSVSKRRNGLVVKSDGSIEVPVWNADGSQITTEYCNIKVCKQSDNTLVIKIV